VRHDIHEAIARLCVLDEPARWAAYLAVRHAATPLTRAEVADRAGVSSRLATFHLEKLVAEGLLEATYERDGSSAAVGHPAKRYRPANLDVEVSIPPRRYDLAAEILAEAVDKNPADRLHAMLAEVAAEYGRQLGSEASADDGDSRMLAVLRVTGYEPSVSGDDVVLRNCPFQQVAAALPEVICRMNLALIEGVLAGAEATSFRAVLAPSAGRCCVVLAA
jgi:predicted ArsR family transcriptional regulator